MAKKSLKYRFLLGVVRLLPVKRIMASPTEKTQRFFRKAYRGENIPALRDDELDISVEKVDGCSVFCVRHRPRSARVGVYLVGGGMLKYPQPAQCGEVVKLAKATGMDLVLPYYPILFTGATLPDVCAMLYALYREILTRYRAEDVCLIGGSSGGNLALGLVSHINAMGEGLPLPGKIYAGSPGTLLLTDAERALARKQERTDVVMSVRAIETVWDGMTGGRDVPDYMKYLQLGDYTGLRDVYMSFGGDEVFLAGAASIKERLESFGVHVTLEVGEGLYHSYAMLPMVKEARAGYQNYLAYLSEK